MNNSDPLVTIIVPAFNTGCYIGEMLECCIKQTYTNLEIIVIDDGSEDDTAEIAQQYANCDKRIRVIRQSNSGVSSARNRGLAEHIGDKVLFLDSDDTFELDLIEKCINIISISHAESVLYGHADGTIDFHNVPAASKLNETYYGGQIASGLLPHFFGHSFQDLYDWIEGRRSLRDGKEHTALWRIMLDSALIRSCKLRFDESMSLGEDTKFINEYFLNSNSVAVLDECLYYLRQRPGSLNATNNDDPFLMLENKIKVIHARQELEQIADERCHVDLWPLWRGTNVLSALQLIIFFAKASDVSLLDARRCIKLFLKEDSVINSVQEFSPSGWGVRSIPFRLLKAHMESFMLFGARGVFYLLNLRKALVVKK